MNKVTTMKPAAATVTIPHGPGRVTSKDGTKIAFEASGTGPPLILVAGALGFKAFPYTQQFAAELAKDFTVINYDRRGRGDSTDTKPYSVQREVEDIAALSQLVGNPFVLGISSGAALALEAAASGVRMRKVVAYEPPYMVEEDRGTIPADFEERLKTYVAEGRRDEAVKFFMRTVGVPGFVVAVMKLFPFWKKLRTVAHTLPYDAAVMGTFAVPTKRLATIRVPTLMLNGEKSPKRLQRGTAAVANAIPGSVHRTLPKQNHGVKPKAISPVLREHLLGS